MYPRKADRVAKSLLVQVVSGQIPVGMLLPREQELAEQHGVNRSVVREAIKLLEVHRLVRPVKRKGTVVLDPLASMSPEVLRAMLEPSPGAIDLDVLRDLLDVRKLIDIEMSVAAAERRTDEDLVALDAKLDGLRAAREDAGRYGRAISDLGLQIARASKNRLFEMMVHWHALVHVDLEALFMTVRRPTENSVQGFEYFVELIRRQDSESIRQVVASYHDWATPRLLAAAGLSGDMPLEKILEELK